MIGTQSRSAESLMRAGYEGTEEFYATDHYFSWRDDGWYTWDDKKAMATARKARDARARELAKAGYKTRRSTTKGLMSFGGIGSGRAHIELWTPIYCVSFRKA